MFQQQQQLRYDQNSNNSDTQYVSPHYFNSGFTQRFNKQSITRQDDISVPQQDTTYSSFSLTPSSDTTRVNKDIFSTLSLGHNDTGDVHDDEPVIFAGGEFKMDQFSPGKLNIKQFLKRPDIQKVCDDTCQEEIVKFDTETDEVEQAQKAFEQFRKQNTESQRKQQYDLMSEDEKVQHHISESGNSLDRFKRLGMGFLNAAYKHLDDGYQYINQQQQSPLFQSSLLSSNETLQDLDRKKIQLDAHNPRILRELLFKLSMHNDTIDEHDATILNFITSHDW